MQTLCADSRVWTFRPAHAERAALVKSGVRLCEPHCTIDNKFKAREAGDRQSFDIFDFDYFPAIGRRASRARIIIQTVLGFAKPHPSLYAGGVLRTRSDTAVRYRLLNSNLQTP